MERSQALALLQKYNQEPFHIMHALTVEGVMRWYAQELGYGICVDVAPEHLMEKVLYAADELTGLIWAAAKMRPSKSTKDMEVKSLKKKFKDKRFAAGCSRDVIKQGAETLGWDLNDLFEKTILAMRSCEDGVRKECLDLTGVEE